MKSPIVIFACLASLMATTRFHHFGSSLHLPDASLAVFFLAGLVLKRGMLFPLFLLEAGLIDYLAISQGTSDWCVTPAYGFLVPTYGVMWLAGRWFGQHHSIRWASLPTLVLTVVASTTGAFMISNGSFYLLSGYFPDMGLMHYAERVAKYYPPYLGYCLMYIAITSLLVIGWKAYHQNAKTLRLDKHHGPA